MSPRKYYSQLIVHFKIASQQFGMPNRGVGIRNQRVQAEGCGYIDKIPGW